MSPITTHILDTTAGRPAAGVSVQLDFQTTDGWESIGEGRTNDDGRVTDLLDTDHPLLVGTYRISFEIGEYFVRRDVEAFYPSASIIFSVRATDEHYHVPLLLNPYGYSTYRGS